MAAQRDHPSHAPVTDRSTAGSTVPDEADPDPRRHPADIAELTELILDRGLVLDSSVRGDLMGLEVWTVDSLMTITTIDTALRQAEAADAAPGDEPLDDRT